MSPHRKHIPVLDLFSGPGGLGEGFSSLKESKPFKIILSAEKDPAAYKTLRLRSYFRLLQSSGINREAYYNFCNGYSKIPWSGPLTHDLWEEAGIEALNVTLGTEDGDRKLHSAIRNRIQSGINCVLIGGPPCQAYSVAGRSRNRSKPEYRPEDDHRHFLYREYLRVLSIARPAVFVMENVKGILSSQVAGRQIFNDILMDLASPSEDLNSRKLKDLNYRIYSLSSSTSFTSEMDISEISPVDFVIRAEDYGIPQARHRVFLLGVRSDITKKPQQLAKHWDRVTLWETISDLPELRSRISGKGDSENLWVETIRDSLNDMSVSAEILGKASFADYLKEISTGIVALPFGANKLRHSISNDRPIRSNFVQHLLDPNLEVTLNHESKSHMREDLKRYAFASCFAEHEGRSPKGHQEFNLPGLAPKHANWESGNFRDRFRVQLHHSPSTTITSHIAKDGHYYIHPDPKQCRSLTFYFFLRLAVRVCWIGCSVFWKEYSETIALPFDNPMEE